MRWLLEGTPITMLRWFRWFAVAAAGLVLLAGCTSRSGDDPEDAGGMDPALEPFAPSAGNEDPATDIDGVVLQDYEAGKHAEPGQRVAYDHAPPFGGAHDQVWADCSGTVYDEPVRTEHMVHALEHGTVWIAYHADEITGDDLAALVERVEGEPYLMLSPYPDLDRPISLQSWGHQLKLDDVHDERIDQFIVALRANQYTSPEPGARCDSDGTGFDVTDPPPYDPTTPGPDAMPVTGS